MASTKSLNAKNLEALGAERLAALLIEISKGSSVAKRRLRLELAGNAGGDDAAREIHKRISAIAKARTFVDWQRTKALVTDLEAQHRAIMEHVAGQETLGKRSRCSGASSASGNRSSRDAMTEAGG